MKCNSCGGTLKLKDGVFQCESCGAKQSIETSFENTDVFICYVENDEQGRRTQDSIIAQDLYNKLQGCNINTFYQRISASDLVENNLEKAAAAAINKTKVILIVGTNIENFNKLLEENQRYFDEKKIIPVYSGINAYDLPQDISSLQAMNYDNIGAAAELPKQVLQLLGRADEIDVIKMADEKAAKKKKKQRIIAMVTALVILIIAIYIVFFTPLVLKSSKYSYAAELTEEGQYIEAIDIYNDLGDYKDSAKRLKGIYDKYSGYYSTDDEAFSVHFYFQDNQNAEIEVVNYIKSKGQVKFTSEAVISDNNTLNYNFTDNQNNQGICSAQLLDDGIMIKVKTTEKSGELVMSDLEYHFKMSAKTDTPQTKKIDKNALLNWLKNGMTKTEILAQGYDLKHVESVGDMFFEVYDIVNTGVQIEVTFDGDVTFISARADIVLLDMIGKKAEKNIYKDGVVYVLCAQSKDKGTVIKKDTMIGMDSQIFNKISYNAVNMIDDTQEPDDYWAWTPSEWDYAVLNYLYGIDLNADYQSRYDNEYGEDYDVSFSLRKKNGSDMLVEVNGDDLNSVFYKINTDTDEVVFLGDIPEQLIIRDSNDFTKILNMQDFPEIFGDFIE